MKSNENYNFKIFYIIVTVLLFISLFCMTNCSTIMHGESQRIEVNSTPQDAKVKIYDANGNTVYTGNTPSVVMLHRAKEYTIAIKIEGYQETKASIKKTSSSFLLGNIVFAGMALAFYPFEDDSSGLFFSPDPARLALCTGVLGVLTAFTIDIVNGSAWKLKPEEISITLAKISQGNNEEKLYTVFHFLDQNNEVRPVYIPMVKESEFK